MVPKMIDVINLHLASCADGRVEERIEELGEVMSGSHEVAEVLDAVEREYLHLFKSFQDFSDRQLEASVQADLERRQVR